MSDDITARLGLPLLSAGQAQKELTHNEALALLDLFAQAVVVAVGIDTPPDAPGPGQCWIIGATPTDAWAGHAHHLAGWTDGGWRFCPPIAGLRAWNLADATEARYETAGWTFGILRGSQLKIAGTQVVGERQPAIVGPAGGTVIDTEARSAVVAILAALHAHGLIA